MNIREPSVVTINFPYVPGSAAPKPGGEIAKYFARPDGERFDNLVMVKYFDRYMWTKEEPRLGESWQDADGGWVRTCPSLGIKIHFACCLLACVTLFHLV